MKRLIAAVFVWSFAVTLAAGLPGVRPELQGFERWTRVASVTDTGGPHAGLNKAVFANPLAANAWSKKGALPVGSIVVKTAGKVSSPSFIAVMLKQKSGWYYEEYFPKNGRYSVGAGGQGGQGLCSGCHGDAKNDLLFTRP
jgi:Cytochrome P460